VPAVVAQLADRVVVLHLRRGAEVHGDNLNGCRIGSSRNAVATAPIARGQAPVHAEPAVRPRFRGTPWPMQDLLVVSGLVSGHGGLDAQGMPRIPVQHDIGYSIAPGSVLGVAGVSGCGKSALAQVIAGLLPAALGRCCWTATRRTAECAKERLKAVRVVFQMAAAIYADKIQSVRAFGQEIEVMQLQTEVARPLAGPTGLQSNMEFTCEHMRLAAIQGLLIDADGSTLFDWFAEFGITAATEIAFDLNHASPVDGALRIQLTRWSVRWRAPRRARSPRRPW
jgi:ABC-type uncharacterized transport system ATPase subunit